MDTFSNFIGLLGGFVGLIGGTLGILSWFSNLRNENKMHSIYFALSIGQMKMPWHPQPRERKLAHKMVKEGLLKGSLKEGYYIPGHYSHPATITAKSV